MRARIHKQLRRKREVLSHLPTPCTAVNKDVDRRVRALGQVNVETLGGRRPVREALGRAEPCARDLAVGNPHALDRPLSAHQDDDRPHHPAGTSADRLGRTGDGRYVRPNQPR